MPSSIASQLFISSYIHVLHGQGLLKLGKDPPYLFSFCFCLSEMG